MRTTKVCKQCNKVFKRNKRYYGKKWEMTKFCSRKCSARHDAIHRRTGMDERKHPKWKGNKVGYYGIHDWLDKHFGQPKYCEICGLQDKARVYHWACLTDDYVRDAINFARMCVPCHRKYDYARKNG